jgi:ribosomal protein L11 methyltransferase
MRAYVEISVAVRDNSQAEILIARLEALGFEGFEETGSYLHAYAPEGSFDRRALDAMAREEHLEVEEKTLPETNWNEEWEKNFEPVVLGDYCAIRASFHPPVGSVQHEIIITPKMSFGTGHHATTCLMILAMRQLDFTGKKVLDFGTGTGILAILAEKSGSANVLAIDVDPGCIGNASENILENRCQAIQLTCRDNLENTGIFDVILANLSRNTLMSNLEDIRQHLTPDGVVLMSGLLAEDVEEITREAGKYELSVQTAAVQENWACIQLKKTADNSRIMA